MSGFFLIQDVTFFSFKRISKYIQHKILNETT